MSTVVALLSPAPVPTPLRPVARPSGGGGGGDLFVRTERRTVPPYSLYAQYRALYDTITLHSYSCLARSSSE